LQRLLRQHGLAVVHGRTTLGRELAYWRESLASDLGGDVSTAQATLIERVACKRLLVGAIETFLLSNPSTVLLKERLYLLNVYRMMSDSLRADLVTLGLQRRAKPVPDLQSYLKARAAEQGEGEGSLLPGSDSNTRTLEVEVPSSDSSSVDKETT
jgi:hypothetical protein